MKIEIEVNTTATAKFDALLNACKQAQDAANVIKAEVNPVIEAVGSAKWKIIVDEFNKFANRYNSFMELCNYDEEYRICDHRVDLLANVTFRNYYYAGKYSALFTYKGVNVNDVKAPDDELVRTLIQYWDGKIIEKLDKRLEAKMNAFIENQAHIAKRRVEVMNNLIG